MDWLTWLMVVYGYDRWCLTVDADELLVYEQSTTQDLRALSKVLDAAGETSFGALMLDMYTKGPLGRQTYKAGDDPIDVLGWFDPDGYRVGFLKFLEFIKANLEGKTSIRVDPNWASQSSILQGFSAFMSPDMVIREAELSEGLAYLLAQVKSACPALTQSDTSAEFELVEIYDAEVERACREAYQRDYMAFGFSVWEN